MKKAIFSLLALAAVVSCAEKTPKALILYYSQTGTTDSLATELQRQTGADIERFDVSEPYTGDYMATIARVKGERENGNVPTLNPISADLSKYDVIYLAYPIWFGTYAPPVKSLVESGILEGKSIVPFCTFGSGGLEASTADLKEALPLCGIAEGFGIRHDRIRYAAEELNRFLIENGYKEGTIDPLPDFSAQDVLIPEELALYREATDGYPFPLGEPVSVGSRTVPEGVDYLFTVTSTQPGGTSVEGKVYVSRRNGRKTEFTKIVR